ncbi:MAG: GspH/FimT family pseudopilin [Acidobacteriia bacterium]|nr:GspH/FimT family pseudopilin [Terriglobia bacterium]
MITHNRAGERPSNQRGFSLVELLIAILIIGVMVAIATPNVQSSYRIYQLRAAASSVSGIIQVTRYRAISSGYPFALVLDKANSTYQVQSDPAGTGTFANVGAALPLSGSSTPATLNQNTTLQFRPSGRVLATTGTTTLVISYSGQTKTIQVSSYGSVTVTP